MKYIIKIKQRGLGLIELLTSIVIASVLILMIGVISNIAFSSYEDLKKEDQVFKDLYFGFDLLIYSLRNASTVSVAGNQLTMVKTTGNPNFSRTFKNDAADFKYTDSDGDHIIIQGVDNLNFDFRCTKDPLNPGEWLSSPPCSSNSSIFHVTLSGEKDKEGFNLSADVARRN